MRSKACSHPSYPTTARSSRHQQTCVTSCSWAKPQKFWWTELSQRRRNIYHNVRRMSSFNAQVTRDEIHWRDRFSSLSYFPLHETLEYGICTPTTCGTSLRLSGSDSSQAVAEHRQIPDRQELVRTFCLCQGLKYPTGDRSLVSKVNLLAVMGLMDTASLENWHRFCVIVRFSTRSFDAGQALQSSS